MENSQKDCSQLWQRQELEQIVLFKAQFEKFNYTKHAHSEFAIGLIESGAAKCFHKGEMHNVPAGTIITLNPDEIHTGEAKKTKGYRYWMAYIPKEVIQEQFQNLPDTKNGSAYFKHCIVQDEILYKYLLKSFRVFDQKSKNLLWAQLLFFKVISILFYRYGQLRYSPQVVQKRPATIRRAWEYINDRATSNISLDDIAKSVGMSRFHFLRVYKSTTGISPYAHLIQRRVELSRMAIKKGYPLAQAAFESGFSDQSHMTRCFKATYGITPGQYRQVHSQKTIF